MECWGGREGGELRGRERGGHDGAPQAPHSLLGFFLGLIDNTGINKDSLWEFMLCHLLGYILYSV